VARGTQFGVLKTMLRNEIGRSNTAGGSGVADFNALSQILNRHYEALYTDFDWPHRRAVFDRIELSAGDRYYDFPDECDYERIEKVVVWYNDQPIPIERGIDFNDYSAFSSEDDIRADPVMKWDVRFTGTEEQMEVWPLPSSNTQEIQIRGIQKFVRLVADADTCKLDDNLVVGFAAAEFAARQGDKDAEAKHAAAQRLYSRLRGRTKGAGKTYVFGSDGETAWPPKNTMIIAR
jgi:hypothetical protein